MKELSEAEIYQGYQDWMKATFSREDPHQQAAWRAAVQWLMSRESDIPPPGLIPNSDQWLKGLQSLNAFK